MLSLCADRIDMTGDSHLHTRFPTLRRRLPRVSLATLPTPVSTVDIKIAGGHIPVSIKHDNLTSELYGGNKVRKLEYLLKPAGRRPVKRIATFGTVGSHHALATSMYCREQGLDCTCFLAHQRKTPSVPAVLDAHLEIGTELVRYGGAYAKRITTLRKHLWHRQARVVPAGGSSWIGALGFVDAALELAAQVDAGEIPKPDRIYVATGTMGSAAGLALGLTLAGLSSEVHAVRVSHTSICSEQGLERLIGKIATMLQSIDPSFPAGLDARVNICLRHEFFCGGYARGGPEIDAAIRLAAEYLGLSLEITYTGKSMAALIADLSGDSVMTPLYWNTYNSARLPTMADPSPAREALPAEFLAYFA